MDSLAGCGTDRLDPIIPAGACWVVEDFGCIMKAIAEQEA
jgi:hypothetical protein